MLTQTSIRIHWLNLLEITPPAEAPRFSFSGLGNGLLPSPTRTGVEVGEQAAVLVFRFPSLEQLLT
jgi:hypothetical protein